MTSYANRITDLEKQIALLKQQELQEEEDKKDNSIEYNLQRIQQILDWNDSRTFNDWTDKVKHHFRYPGGDDNFKKDIKNHPGRYRGIMRNIILFNDTHIPHANDNHNEKKLDEYNRQNNLPKIGPAMLDMLQSINTSLNILNQRVSKIEKLIDDKKTD